MWMQRFAVFVISVKPELYRVNIQKFSDDLLSKKDRRYKEPWTSDAEKPAFLASSDKEVPLCLRRFLIYIAVPLVIFCSL